MTTPPQPQPQQPLQPVKVQGKCYACRKEMTFIIPVPRIFNEIDVSVIAVAHPPSRCPNCTAIHIPLIAGINQEGGIDFTWQLAKMQRAPLVVGGNDATLKQAIEQAAFTEKIKSN